MKKKYVTDVDFLPRNGFLYVDTCGIKWVGPKKKCNNGYWDAQRRRITSFYHVFEKRGNVVTTNSILEEISNNVEFFKEKRKEMNNSMRSPYHIGDTKKEIKTIDGSIKMCGKIYALLKNNMKTCIPREYVIRPEDARNFVENFVPRHNKKLSSADKELVTAALFAGPISSILTADVPMMEAYWRGVKIFQLRKHSLCDAINSTINYLP